MYKTNGLPSHTCTVLRECCKDDDESLWKSLKFDPSPRKNALADRPRNLQRRLGPGCLPSAKFCPDRTRVFFIPIRMKYHYSGSAIISFLVLPVVHSRGPHTDLHAKCVRRRGSAQWCAFGVWKKNQTFRLPFSRKTAIFETGFGETTNFRPKTARQRGRSRVNCPNRYRIGLAP